ncbi:AsmA [Methylophilaceae bacterium]
MKRFFTPLALALAGLLSLLLVAWLTLLLCFNPNDYKQTIIHVVQEKTGRTLTLDGDISMAFWPTLGIDLGRVSLSEQGSQKPFASVARAKVSLAILPLLQKKLLVGTVYLDGVQAMLIQHADGSNNFADLFDGDSNATFSYDIDGLIVKNSRLDYINEASNSRIQLSNLSIKTGRIMQDQALDMTADFLLEALAAKLKTKVNLQARLLYQSKERVFLAENLRLSTQGELAMAKLNATLHANKMSASKGVMVAPMMQANVDLNSPPQDLKMRWQFNGIQANALELNIAKTNADITYANGKRLLTSQFSTPIKAQWSTATVGISQLNGRMNWQDQSRLSAGLKADFELTAKADFKHKTGQSRFHFASGPGLLDGDIQLSQTAGPNIKFNLAAQNWDAYAYLARPNKTARSEASPIDLSALNKLQLDGQLKLENINYAPYQLHTLQAHLLSDGKKLQAKGLMLKLDDSKIRGEVAMTLQASPAYKVNLAIDKLDLNRYQTAEKNTPANKVHSAKPHWELADLKHHQASGDIRIGQLGLNDTLAKNVHISLQGPP